jgi:hypothetical protein
MVVIMAAVILQAHVIQKMLNTADASTALSKKVAGHLQRYDTDAVDAELAAYHKSGDADGDLHDAFDAIVTNLNAYRPHIPNWMLRAASDEDEDEVDFGQPLMSARSDSPGGGLTASLSLRSVLESTPDPADRLQPSQSGAPLSRSCSPRHGLSGQSLSGSFLGSGSGMRSPMALASGSNSFLSPDTFVGKISYALVDVCVERKRDGWQMNRFVDRVHALAAATHGSLHGFVGDTVQISWNATHRAVMTETKAARFLCGLQADAGGDGLVVAGAAHTGDARCIMAGGAKAQAFTASMPWREALFASHRFATQHRAFVVDEVTEAACAMTFETRGVEVIQLPAPAQMNRKQRDTTECSTLATIFELVSEKMQDDDEWMYALAKGTDGNPNRAVTEALRCCEVGAFANAIAKLDGVAETAAEVAAAPLVQHLRRRAEQMVLARTPAGFYCNVYAAAAPVADVATVDIACNPIPLAASADTSGR